MAEPLTTEEIEAANALQDGYFDENVDLFEPPLPEGVPEHLAAIVRACRLQPGERMLDVGTGTGILIPYILQYRPSEIHACDLSENMLRRVKRKFPQVITHHCGGAYLVKACLSLSRSLLDDPGSLPPGLESAR